jgi:nitrite reductase (NADH) small subunit
VRLGGVDEVRARLPLAATFAGQRFRIVDLDGEMVAHAAACPHWLGPLEDAPVIDGAVTCPWHGYAFDVRTGACVSGQAMRLVPAPRVVVQEGVVVLIEGH